MEVTVLDLAIHVTATILAKLVAAVMVGYAGLEAWDLLTAWWRR